MKPLLFAMLCGAAAVSAQTVLTVTGPDTIMPGQSGVLAISIAGTAGTNLGGVQWTFQLPDGATLGNPTIAELGPNSPNGLGIFCGAPANTCLIIGLNGQQVSISPLADGVLANVPFSLGMAAGPGTYVLPIASVTGASTRAESLPVTVGAVYHLKILSRCDLNGDGAVNVADVKAMVAQTIGTAVCSLAGGCTVRSVMAVILASLGQGCSL